MHHRTRSVSRARGTAPAVAVAVVAAVAALGVTACASTTGASPATPPSSRVIHIVAAENFWGSLAAQLGGPAVDVTSILSDPNADPHSIETTSSDARAFADAAYVIVNGAGYDGWAQKLLSSNPRAGRRTLDVAALLGKKDGDNPHFWYSPADVSTVVARIEADLVALDPGDRAGLAARQSALEAAFGPLRAREAAIRSRFTGTAVASTESIFVYVAQALGLDLISPTDFMNAVAEGNDPPAPSVTAFEDQITSGRARVLVYNQQTVTQVTTTMRSLAARAGIPVVAITETIQPPGATFEQWLGGELDRLETALGAAGGGL